MKLIDNWKEAWKFNSVQTAVLIAALSGLYAAFPVFAQAIPSWVYALSMMTLSVALIILRVIQQNLGR